MFTRLLKNGVKHNPPLVAVCILALSVIGVSIWTFFHRMNTAWVPLVSDLSVEQSISLTKCLRDGDIDFQLGRQGKNILVKSDLVAVIHRDLLTPGVCTLAPKKHDQRAHVYDVSIHQHANEISLKVIEKLSHKKLPVDHDARDRLSEALDRAYGQGRARVAVYRDQIKDQWTGTADNKKSRVITAIIFDEDLLTDIVKQKSNVPAATQDSLLVHIRQDFSRSLHQEVAHVLKRAGELSDLEVIVAYKSLDIQTRIPTWVTLKTFLPYSHVGTTMLSLAMLAVEASVSSLTESLSAF